ncbi:MAG: hypothetical protein BroJett030_11850 [Alphaproteobacteria bacterium]|nr:MAG: hypothetical protein BroJett030_11850 [Alphaproteobacteria bacterium]
MLTPSVPPGDLRAGRSAIQSNRIGIVLHLVVLSHHPARRDEALSVASSCPPRIAARRDEALSVASSCPPRAAARRDEALQPSHFRRTDPTRIGRRPRGNHSYPVKGTFLLILINVEPQAR